MSQLYSSLNLGINQEKFRHEMSSIAGVVHSYKSATGCTWTVGRKYFNKAKLIRRYNQPWFRHSKIAKKHFTLVQSNLKITNSPFSTRHLIYIDADTKNGIGSSKDVAKLFSALKQYFPNLKECSNERGGSAWIVVDCLLPSWRVETVSIKEWNSNLKEFTAFLNALALKHGLKFSELAAYGSIPETVGESEITDLKIDDKFLFKCPSDDSYILETTTFAKLKKIIDTLDKVVPARNAPTSAGSTFEKAQKQIAHIQHEIMADSSRPVKAVSKKNRHITCKMAAEYIHAISCLKANADGTMPHRRIIAFISMMYQRGVYEHGADNSVLTTIRNWLSAKGAIVWTDNKHSIGNACKWEMSLQLKQSIREDKSLSYFVSTTCSTDYIKPQKRIVYLLPEHWQETVDEAMETYSYKLAA